MSKLKVDKINGVIFIILFFLFIITFVSIFFGSIMRLFGFEYDSFKSVMLFFVAVEIIGFPSDCLEKGLSKALLKLDLIGKFGSECVSALLGLSSSILSILIVDYFMDSVKVPPIAVLVLSLTAYLFGLFLNSNSDDKEEDSENKTEDNNFV